MGNITDRERRELHERAEAALGKKAADTLMAHLPPVGWADVATKTDLRLLMAEITAQINDKISELDDKIAGLREEMKQRDGELREGMQKMRGDLIRSNTRGTLWVVIAVSTMPQVVAEILSKF